MEIWDLYNADGTPTGFQACRGTNIPDGHYHIISEVILKHKETQDILVMKRSRHKNKYPGCWEITAGGCAVTGESPEECMLRELYEETGMTADKYDLLGIQVHKEEKAIFYLYIAYTELSKSCVRLQAGETEDSCWIPSAEMEKFLKTANVVLATKDDYLELLDTIINWN